MAYNGNWVEYTDGDRSTAGPNPIANPLREFLKCTHCGQYFERIKGKHYQINLPGEIKDMDKYLEDTGDYCESFHCGCSELI